MQASQEQMARKNHIARQIHPKQVKSLSLAGGNQKILANFKQSLLAIHDKKRSSSSAY